MVRFLLCVMLLAAWCTAFAQRDSLTLAQCIDRALRGNAEIRIARAGVRGAERHRDALDASRMPFVSARSHLLWAPATGYDSALTNGGEFAAQLAATWPVYDGGLRALAIDQSSVDLQRAQGDSRATARDLMFETTQAFLVLAFELHTHASYERSVAQLEEYLALTTRLRGGGAAEETDVLKTSIQLASERVALRESDHRIHDAATDLARVIGDGEPAIAIRDTLAADTLFVPPTAPPTTMEERNAQLAIESAKFDVSLIRAEFHPTLSLAADAGAWTSLLNLRAQQGLHNVFGYSALAELQVPLWNGGATDRRAEEREAIVESLEARVALIRTVASAEWASARDEYLTARDAFLKLRESVASAEQNYSLSHSLYAGGHSTSLEVLDAQRLLTETTIDVERARTRMLAARALMDRIAAN